MELIEDLGLRPSGDQGRNRRLGLYECPICHKHFECRVDTVKSGYTTKCRSCAGKSKVTKAASEFLEKARAIHGDLYEYLLDDYINNKTKIKITCPIHGVFEQTPDAHLRGCGCPICASKTSAEMKICKAASEFLEKAKAVHGDKYDYTPFQYNGALSKSKFGCRIHGVFEQTPSAHLNGQGCPQCALTGFDKNKSAILYYLKVSTNDTIVYKIGITNRTVKARFNNEDLSKITILKTWSYPLGAEAYDKEQEILKVHADYKYTGEPLLSSGNTELFIVDVLGLDEESLC